jgi:uncharacterized protein YdhG (YjbR/CyaY superfamily)
MKPEIEAYFSHFSPEIQSRLLRVREIFLGEVPDADEAIKYQMPTILWHGNLIHYAAFSRHIGVYPLPSVLIELKDEIGGYKTGKGSIQFSNDELLPEDLIRKIVIKRKEEKLAEIARKGKK